MKGSKKQKLLIPRVRIEHPDDEFLEGCRDDSADKIFRERYSNRAMIDLYDDVLAYLAKRGWIGGKKDGVSIDSPEAFEIDRASACRFSLLDSEERLAAYVAKATPDQLKALRVAWEAGALSMEAKAYRELVKGGRPRETDQIHKEIGVAYHKWRKANPTKEPKASDLAKIFMGNVGGTRNFANRVSEWRKIQRNSSSE